MDMKERRRMKLEERHTEYVLTINDKELNQIYWALRQCVCKQCQYTNCSSKDKKNCYMLSGELVWETVTPYQAYKK